MFLTLVWIETKTVARVSKHTKRGVVSKNQGQRCKTSEKVIKAFFVGNDRSLIGHSSATCLPLISHDRSPLLTIGFH